jgi:hypothetical protein
MRQTQPIKQTLIATASALALLVSGGALAAGTADDELTLKPSPAFDGGYDPDEPATERIVGPDAERYGALADTVVDAPTRAYFAQVEPGAALGIAEDDARLNVELMRRDDDTAFRYGAELDEPRVAVIPVYYLHPETGLWVVQTSEAPPRSRRLPDPSRDRAERAPSSARGGAFAYRRAIPVQRSAAASRRTAGSISGSGTAA